MKSTLFGFVTVVPPRLHITVVPDSVVVSAGRVGESFRTIRTRVGLLASTICVPLSVNKPSDDARVHVLDILVCFEVEFCSETLTTFRTDDWPGEQAGK